METLLEDTSPVLTQKWRSETVEGSKYDCFGVIIRPAILNARSEEAAVAGMARYLRASHQILGNSLAFPFHQESKGSCATFVPALFT